MCPSTCYVFGVDVSCVILIAYQVLFLYSLVINGSMADNVRHWVVQFVF